MRQITFAPVSVRTPEEYLIGQESLGLRAFRSLLPPFIHLEIIQEDTPEYENFDVHSVTFEAGDNFASNVMKYMSRLVDDRMGQGAKEFHTFAVGDSITPDADGKKLVIPMIKAIIAEMTQILDHDYIEGVTKVYVIHPPELEDELHRHFSVQPVPSVSSSPLERLISVAVGQETRSFVVEPYKMELTRRHSPDPRWLVVHLYNPALPALAIRVGSQGPLTFRQPTPLLSDTEVAENWTMSVLQDYLRASGIEIRGVCYEPNGPKTFPDYRATVEGASWDFEITRVLGDILTDRHILDKPRDSRQNINMAVQSRPIEDGDVKTALYSAIESKKRKSRPDGVTRGLCLVLLNALDLDIGSQSTIWQDMDLDSLDAVALVNGYDQPSVELIKGHFS